MRPLQVDKTLSNPTMDRDVVNCRLGRFKNLILLSGINSFLDKGETLLPWNQDHWAFFLKWCIIQIESTAVHNGAMRGYQCRGTWLMGDGGEIALGYSCNEIAMRLRSGRLYREVLHYWHQCHHSQWTPNSEGAAPWVIMPRLRPI